MHGPQSGNLGRLRDRWEGRPAAAAVIAAVALALVPILTGCASDDPAKATAPKTTSAPTSTATVQDVMELEDFAPLEPGTYFVDPDGDSSTPLRVVYEIPVEGWSSWIGGVKFADYGHIGVSITTVTNLVRHGCRDHRPADPAVGPSVGDLATALADLAPFRVTSPPEDVTIYGYSGKYLELTVPDLPVEGSGGDRSFPGCKGETLMSWIAPLLGGGFYGYNSEAGRTEELWILDVDGIRLVIEANWSPASPRRDVAEMRAILDSIRIEP
jgi:hypothetical protein